MEIMSINETPIVRDLLQSIQLSSENKKKKFCKGFLIKSARNIEKLREYFFEIYLVFSYIRILIISYIPRDEGSLMERGM